jgi:O-antigen/teichoic acid export membrane protein
MSGKTIGLGIALILLGVVGYIASSSASVTALIPAFFGVPLLILGLLARDDNKRKTAMHIAAVIGLLGFVGSLYSLLSRGEISTPGAIVAQLIMAALTGTFVGLCVKSFIDARRSPS